MIADDLFAGAGGWDLAAAQLGIHARGVENMKEARATRDAAGLTTIHDDAWTFQPDGTATGLIASPPCQTFSAAGKGSGRKALDDVLGAIWNGAYYDIGALRDIGEQVGDQRTALVLTPLHFAMTGGYEWLAWEQVPTVLPVWQACAEVLRTAGWKAWAGLAQAEQYGVPQTRKRAFLLASRRGDVGPPEPTHSRYYSRDPGKLDLGVEKWVSMAEALSCDPAGHMRSNYGTGGDPRKRGERQLTQPAPTITSKIDRNLWALRGNQRPDGGRNRVDAEGYILRPGDEPSITITGNACSYRWAELPAWALTRPATVVQGDPRIAAPGHRCMTKDCHPGREPESMMAQATRVTIEEAGVLQSFPADWPWRGNKGERFLQCGNAVPPGMALHALAAASGINVEERAA